MVPDRHCLQWGAQPPLNSTHLPAALPPPAKEASAAVKRASGSSAKATTKPRGSLWSAESAAALKAIGAGSSRKKPDGWAFSRPPSHTARSGGKTPAEELQALKDQQQLQGNSGGTCGFCKVISFPQCLL